MMAKRTLALWFGIALAAAVAIVPFALWFHGTVSVERKTLTSPATSVVTNQTPVGTTNPSETGRASWYELQGTTASGDAMRSDALTAAHPSLPLGTQVLVENLDKGTSVVVTINDRGPFARNRIIDLSKAAAEKLDMIADGVANVRVRRIAAYTAGIELPK